jgi:hypothetical protein
MMENGQASQICGPSLSNGATGSPPYAKGIVSIRCFIPEHRAVLQGSLPPSLLERSEALGVEGGLGGPFDARGVEGRWRECGCRLGAVQGKGRDRGMTDRFARLCHLLWTFQTQGGFASGQGETIEALPKLC